MIKEIKNSIFYKNLPPAFEKFILINFTCFLIMIIDGWIYTPLIFITNIIIGGWIDGIKEDALEFNQGYFWNDELTKNGIVKIRDTSGSLFQSKKEFNTLLTGENYLYDYLIKRAHRRNIYYKIRADIFSNKNLWWLRVHLFSLTIIFTCAYFAPLIGLEAKYFWFQIPSFLTCEIGYYLYTNKKFYRFFPKGYFLWKFWTQEKLYKWLTFSLTIIGYIIPRFLF